ncbi:Capsid protein [Vibrio aestuarianus]|nr:Capsid protein [Vibrio aestuarianus]
MPKTSDWVVIATEGSTVDGRKITKPWINDMAALYSKDEYTALIWPEHWRSSWAPFEGKNWGVVEELKAEVLDDKLRLFAKITANQYLLDANKEGQKLFTSIEPNPDYKGEGRCYLMGLAATDSPASTGTSLLQFSRRKGEETALQADALEEIDLSGFYALSSENQTESRETLFASTLEALAKLFRTGGKLPEQHTNDSQPEDEEPMNKEQFSEMMAAISSIGTKQGELEEKFNTFSTNQTSTEVGEETTTGETSGEETATGITAEQFSKLTEQLGQIANQQKELDNKFNALSGETSGQRPPEEGAGDLTVEAL